MIVNKTASKKIRHSQWKGNYVANSYSWLWNKQCIYPHPSICIFDKIQPIWNKSIIEYYCHKIVTYFYFYYILIILLIRKTNRLEHFVIFQLDESKYRVNLYFHKIILLNKMRISEQKWTNYRAKPYFHKIILTQVANIFTVTRKLETLNEWRPLVSLVSCDRSGHSRFASEPGPPPPSLWTFLGLSAKCS